LKDAWPLMRIAQFLPVQRDDLANVVHPNPLSSNPNICVRTYFQAFANAQSRDAAVFCYMSHNVQVAPPMQLCQVVYCPARSFSRWFSTAKFESINLSTQFCTQLSSLPASLPDDIEPVMHFLKQVSVSSWTDLCTVDFWFSFCINCCSSRLSPGVNLASSSVLTLTDSESSMVEYARD